jgi:hypothetical protein
MQHTIEKLSTKDTTWLPTTKSPESPRFLRVQVACNISLKSFRRGIQFDSRPLKVLNHPDFLVCKSHVTYRWKALDEGYNFASNIILIGGLHTKLWAPKIAKISAARISGLTLGSPRTKWHLGAGPVASHRIYQKGEGGGIPQVRAVVSLMSLSLPVVSPSTKSASTMH